MQIACLSSFHLTLWWKYQHPGLSPEKMVAPGAPWEAGTAQQTCRTDWAAPLGNEDTEAHAFPENWQESWGSRSKTPPTSLIMQVASRSTKQLGCVMIRPQMTIEIAPPPFCTKILYRSNSVLITSACMMPVNVPALGSRNHVYHHA